MKLRHNKKRNTAFVFEILINEVSKASMHNENEREQNVLNIIKKYFHKGSILKEELEIYRSFDDLEDIRPGLIEKIITESKVHAKNLDEVVVYEQQTKLINEANKILGSEIWNKFVSSYKKLATINQVLCGAQSPKKQVFVEQKLVDMLTQQEKIEKQPFPAVNKLALKTFLGNFNEKYSDSLNESQKRLLKEYITSYRDNGAEFNMYLYEEITRLKDQLTEQLQTSDKSEKLSLVLEKIQSYQNKKIDRKTISEIIKIQSLVDELNNGN
tara:strand:- start:847 stop:1656 length:810 start_codon:yes stop_codon:yes gene_type:complete